MSGRSIFHQKYSIRGGYKIALIAGLRENELQVHLSKQFVELQMFRQNNMIYQSHLMRLIIFMFPIVLFSCTSQRTVTEVEKDKKIGSSVIDVANEILDALEKKDAEMLAKLVHPKKGVRFSPSAFVDIEIDRVFSSVQIEQFWEDRRTYTWGYEDASGDPIVQTPTQYCREYITTLDFRRLAVVNVNDDQATGNTANNASVVYPTATRVEYYIKPSMLNLNEQVDWEALRLIFERHNGSWFLVGVIHARWSV